MEDHKKDNTSTVAISIGLFYIVFWAISILAVGNFI